MDSIVNQMVEYQIWDDFGVQTPATRRRAGVSKKIMF
jgi:hypothetical protein